MSERAMSASIHIRLQESTLENRPICAAWSASKDSISRVLLRFEVDGSSVSCSPGPKYAATESMGTSLLNSGGAAKTTFIESNKVANANAETKTGLLKLRFETGEMAMFRSMILFARLSEGTLQDVDPRTVPDQFDTPAV
jgi:hypothetical protein